VAVPRLADDEHAGAGLEPEGDVVEHEVATSSGADGAEVDPVGTLRGRAGDGCHGSSC
jgi:hypothetical protein